jgi:cobaltochelatase CobN
MMEHGYAGAGAMSEIMSNLWGWQVTNPDLITDEMWNTMYSIYAQDEYDLGLTDWLNENNAWARQEMMARMIESTRMLDSEGNPYWNPSDEIKAALAQEYQQSVEKYGPCCCIVCCGNPLIDSYVKGLLEPGAEAKHHSSSSDTHPPEWSEADAGATNQTETSSSSSSSPTGVGITGDVVPEPPSETSKSSDAANRIEGQVMTEMKTSSSLPISGAPLMAIIAVIVIMLLVGMGLWLKRR